MSMPRKSLPRPEAEAEVTRAVKRVYARYGHDLAAFFRQVQRRNAQQTAESSPSQLRVAFRRERTR